VSHSTDAGDVIPRQFRTIEVQVAELRQLFNAIDPSPFHERDLDPRAEEFIVGWSTDLPDDASLALLVHLERAPGRPDEAAVLRNAIHEFFGQRAEVTRRRLRELLRRGRTSLLIALAFLATSVAAGDLLAAYFPDYRVAGILREGFLIGGWVAMWRPIEVFLYDWWPIRAEARNFDRLATMPVRIRYTVEAPSDAWKLDWPERPAAGQAAPHAETVRAAPHGRAPES